MDCKCWSIYDCFLLLSAKQKHSILFLQCTYIVIKTTSYVWGKVAREGMLVLIRPPSCIPPHSWGPPTPPRQFWDAVGGEEKYYKGDSPSPWVHMELIPRASQELVVPHNKGHDQLDIKALISQWLKYVHYFHTEMNKCLDWGESCSQFATQG